MSLPHLLLGLLSARPMSGYDLNKEFNSAVQHFWSTDQSQIYRTLYKLEGDGLVKAETIVQADSPNKKVYHVTEAGKSELIRWLGQPLPTAPIREAWLGQLYFSHHLDSAAIMGVLQGYRDEVAERLAALETLQTSLPPAEAWGQVPREFQFQLLTLDYGLEIHRFELAWLDKTIERIQQFTNLSLSDSNPTTSRYVQENYDDKNNGGI